MRVQLIVVNKMETRQSLLELFVCILLIAAIAEGSGESGTGHSYCMAVC